VIVNGKPLPVGDLKENSLVSLLEHLQLSAARVAVEINASVVKRAEYNQTRLHDDDVIEIIHFVGGGI